MKILQIREQHEILTKEKEDVYQKLKRLQEIADAKEKEILDKLTNTFATYGELTRIGVSDVMAEWGPFVEIQIETYLLTFYNNEITIKFNSSVSPINQLTDTLVAKIKEDINNTLSYL